MLKLRFVNQRACDGEALALAAGYLQAPLADHGIDPLGHRLHEIPGPGRPKGGLDVRFADFGIIEREVLRDRRMQQGGLLRNVTDQVTPSL